MRNLVFVPAAFLLTACGVFGAPSVRPGTTPRLLVVARAATPESAPLARAAADLLAAGLRENNPTLAANDLVREAALVETPLAAGRLLKRLEAGGAPTPDEGRELARRFEIAGVFVVDVTTFDQVWGRFAKFTRVGLSVDVFDAASAERAMRLHHEVEVEDKRGRAFQYAMEQAVGELTRALGAGPAFTPVEAWRFWRR